MRDRGRGNTGRVAGLVLIVAAGLAGCSGHYQVTDPASGRVYYTRDVEQGRRAGHVEFTDEVSGAKVTLQSSEIKKIDAEAYKAAVGKK